MGIQLNVTTETLIRTADNIEKKISDIQKQFRSIETDINNTRSWWEGEASDVHKAQYDSLKDEMEESIRRLKDSPTNLLRMAGLYRETELHTKEAAMSLQEDVIV